MSDHHHHHHGTNNHRALIVSLAVVVVFMLVEAIGGLLTGSLALLSDAGHMLSDGLALALSLFAFWFAKRAPDSRRSFGYLRFEILAAAINGLTLLLIAVLIFYEGINRLFDPPEIASTAMLIIATLGLAVNVFQAWYMHRTGDTEHNLNLKSAYLHVISDMLGSLAAIIAALLMIAFSWRWADPVASMIVAGLILLSGWRVTRSTWHILMEGTPENLSLEEIGEKIRGVDGVVDIHDLHIWTLTSHRHALIGHVVVNADLRISESQHIIEVIEHQLHEKGIEHVTIQVETPDHGHANALLCQPHSH